MEERCHAAERRIADAGGTAKVEVGTADATAAQIVEEAESLRAPFPLSLDPYNLNDLPFSVIEAFSELKSIDMLIHVSVQDLQRNLDAYSASEHGPLDRFAPGWRQVVDLKQTQVATRASLISYWISRIEALGLSVSQNAALVTGPIRHQRLYWLVFVGRHPLAKEFWDKISERLGQGELPKERPWLMASSDIEWTEATWNPVAGCTILSPGCTNCYAMRLAARLAVMGQDKYVGTTRKSGGRAKWNGTVKTDPPSLDIPRRLEKGALDIRQQHVRPVPRGGAALAFIRKVFEVMEQTPQHTYQVLTKRAERLSKELSKKLRWPTANVWMGVSVESEDYTYRVDHLRRTKAKTKFLSLEPLLGPLDELDLRGVHWAIAGGESGPGARPMPKDWVRSIRDQCINADVPFHFKQWGGKKRRILAAYWPARFGTNIQKASLSVETTPAPAEHKRMTETTLSSSPAAASAGWRRP